jgi:phage tail sheath protein FI
MTRPGMRARGGHRGPHIMTRTDAISGVSTSITAFVGRTPAGPLAEPTACSSFAEFERLFGGLDASFPLAVSVRDFFQNGGREALLVRLQSDAGVGPFLTARDYIGSRTEQSGIFALEKADLFNMLCIPPDTWGGTTPGDVYRTALAYCHEKRAMFVVDPPADWTATPETAAETAAAGVRELGLNGIEATNGALYFPRLKQAPDEDGGDARSVPPSGAVAGVIARTDGSRGVWRAPAGLDAYLVGIEDMEVRLDDRQSAQLTAVGINCLRSFPGTGPVIWGARTLHVVGSGPDEYRYVPVRRLALHIEESLQRGISWAVEPNGESLWARIGRDVGAFLAGLHRQGAFAGGSARDAYFVKCDDETTTPADVDRGALNVVVGFAPLKPAEFVIVNICLLTAG